MPLNASSWYASRAVGRAFLWLFALVALAACGNDSSPVDSAAPGGAGAPAATSDHTAQAVAEPAAATREVAGDVLAYADVEGQLVRGYFAYPVDMIEPLPAALLIHDWFGLDDEMRKVADRVASLGFIVLAVDLFGEQTASKIVDARQMLQLLVEQPDAARDNIRQAYTFLKESVGAPKVAVIGWGSGGLWSLNTALMFPEQLAGVVIVQGQFVTDSQRLSTLSMPVLGIFGAADRDIPNAKVHEFTKILDSLGISHNVRLYPQAGRGFMLPGSRSYSEKQANNAWQELSDFLASNLAYSGG